MTNPDPTGFPKGSSDRSPDGQPGSDGPVAPEMAIRWESDRSRVWWTTPEGEPLAPTNPDPPHQPLEVAALDAQPPGRRPRKGLVIVLVVAAALSVVGGIGITWQMLVDESTGASGGTPAEPVQTRSSSGTGDSPQASSGTTEPGQEATPTPPNLSGALTVTRGSVARVIASTCEGSGIGTGFLIGPDQMVASYPSVAQSVATVVQIGDEVIPARVVGADPQSGVALLALTRNAEGDPLAIAPANASTGTAVLSVGLPFRTDTVSGEESTLAASGSSVDYRGTDIGELSALSGNNDRGLSGAPVVTSSGEVVGAVLALPSTAGRWLVGAEQLNAGIERARIQPAPEATCDKPTGPHSDTRIKGEVSSKLKKGLLGYFTGINKGDEAAAWRNMGPAYHTAEYSLRSFDWTSTYDFDITVHRTWTSAGKRRAWVTFVAINDPSQAPKGLEGEWCARWSFDYEFSDGGDRYLLNGNPGHDGAKIKMKRC